LEIPRSTLQHWLKRRDAIDADPELVAFFESPVGVAFLHRLILGAHFVMSLLGTCGLRLVCLFFEITGLDQFVAVSYGAQQKVANAIEKTVVTYGNEERDHLAEGMTPKKITISEDETFHPEPCLVGIEPVSNFIILEKYTPDRTAEQWTSSLIEALKGLPVEVIQSTSDEGKGILHHVKEDLGAHHSPDVFHVQHELVKATSVALASKKEKAEKEVEEARKELEQRKAEQEAYCNSKAGRGRPPNFDKRIEEAQARESEAVKFLDIAQVHQESAKEAIHGISNDYHPYNLETGAPKSAEEVCLALEKHFAAIEKVALGANLPERCIKKIEKAKRVMSAMIGTIAFFFLTIKAKAASLLLSEDLTWIVSHNMIPGIYLRIASAKAKNAAERKKLKDRSEELLVPLLARDGPLSGLEERDRLLIWHVAEECARIFQRSSSCVEGRNGQLALRHHSLHKLRDQKLAALTTVHNYYVKRSDGTTAAERFFGKQPRDLFEYILDRVDLPGRPAKKRAQTQSQDYLLRSAA
jgi:hypothetical protein